MMVTSIERHPVFHSHDLDYDSHETNLQCGGLLHHNIDPACVVAAAAVFTFICNLFNPVNERFTTRFF
jgi:hypothetical protein